MTGDQFKDFILQNGLILGLVFGFISLMAYMISVEVLVGWTVRLTTFALAIIAPTYYGMKYREINDGFLEFKEAFLMIFSVFALSWFIATIFDIFLFNIMDTELANKVVELDKLMIVELNEKVGATETQIDEQLARFDGAEEQYSIMGLLNSYFYTLIFALGISAIGAAIVKKSPPVFDQE